MNYDFIKDNVIAEIREHYKKFNVKVIEEIVSINITGMEVLKDLQESTYILMNEDLSSMGNDNTTLIIDGPNNTFVTSPAEYPGLGMYKHQVFTDYMNITTKPLDNQKFIPYQLLFLKISTQKI